LGGKSSCLVECLMSAVLLKKSERVRSSSLTLSEDKLGVDSVAGHASRWIMHDQ
jgi:hypothetical protein